MADDITLKIGADYKDANQSMKKFEKDTTEALESIQGSFTLLKTVAAAAVAIFAGKAIVNGLTKAIDAASEADLAVSKLNLALASTGEFSEEASQELQDYASLVQQTTTFSDDAVISALALAKSFGITNTNAKNLVDAATDLSVALGVDLETAVTQLGGTLTGSVGKLAKLGPEFKNLTDAQLRAGDAIKLVTQRFGDFAEGVTGTFSGAIAQANNSFDDIFESLGKIITRNPAIIAAINASSKVFVTLSEIIDDNAEAISQGLANAISSLAGLLINTIDGARRFGEAIKSIDYSAIAIAVSALAVSFGALFVVLNAGAIASAATALAALAVSAFTAASGFAALTVAAAPSLLALAAITAAVGGVLIGLDALISKLFGTEKIIDRLGQSIYDFKAAITGTKEPMSVAVKSTDKLGEVSADSKQDIDKLTGSITEQLKSIRDFKPKSDEANKALSGIGKGLDKTAAKTKEELDKIKGELDSFIAKNADLAKDIQLTGKNEYEQIAINLEFDLKRLDAKKEQLKAEGLLTKELEDQIDKQKKLLSDKADATAQNVKPKDEEDKKPPTAGEALSAATTEFAKPLTSMVSALQGIVDLIPNILSSITNLLSSATKLPNEILKGLHKVIISAVNFLAKGIPTLFKNIPKIFAALIKGLLVAIPEALIGLLEALPGLILQLLGKLPELVTQLLIALTTKIPELIIAIAENFGPIVLALVEGLINAVPRIIVALVDELILKGGIVRIVVALAQAIPLAAISLGQAFVDFISKSTGTMFDNEKLKSIFTDLGNKIASGFKSFFSGLKTPIGTTIGKDIVTSLKNAAGDIGDEIAKSIKKAVKGIGNIGGGGGGVVDSIKGAVGLASGGTIPPGFNNDSFSSFLSSGELVVPQDDVTKLRAFLDNQGNAQGGTNNQALIEALVGRLDRSSEKNLTINLQVGEKQIADVILNLNRKGFRTA